VRAPRAQISRITRSDWPSRAAAANHEPAYLPTLERARHSLATSPSRCRLQQKKLLRVSVVRCDRDGFSAEVPSRRSESRCQMILYMNKKLRQSFVGTPRYRHADDASACVRYDKNNLLKRGKKRRDAKIENQVQSERTCNVRSLQIW